MATGSELCNSGGRRFALLLANGAYTQRSPLSRTVAAAVELRHKLEGMGFVILSANDQTLDGMRTTTCKWLEMVEKAVDLGAEEEDALGKSEPLLLFFTFCGHGRAGQFYPVDYPKPATEEDPAYCFFEDFLFRLYETLAGHGNIARRYFSGRKNAGSSKLFTASGELQWQLPGARIIAIVESCRRLSGEEKKAYEHERVRIANGRRHMLPCLSSMRPDLATMDGSAWDATRLAFLSHLGIGAPQLLLALSSESTTPSYDVVFLRSIVESLGKPVRLGGILERATLDTLRRTGHKQKPVVLSLGSPPARRCIFEMGDGWPLPQDLVLVAASRACSKPLLRASSSPMPHRCTGSLANLDDHRCGSLEGQRRRRVQMAALAVLP